MRPLLIASLFVVLGFAGCIDSDLLNPDDETGSSQDTFQADPSLQEMPERSFEPELILDAPELIELQVEQGTQVNFTFNITDLHDYPFPLTFVDWNLTYSREPNPVAEGDAHDLPAEWNRTLFAEDFHFFTLAVDDGQGFKANKTIVIKVGDPPIPESGVIEEGDTGGGGDAVFEPMAIDKTVATEGTCSAVCTVLGTSAGRSLAAAACPGMKAGTNGVGCAWVEIPPSAVGASFTISDNAGNDPDARALDACKPNAVQIESYGAIGPESGEILPGTGCLMAWFFEDAVGDIAFHVDEFQNAISGHIPYDTEPLLSYSTQPAAGCFGDVMDIVHGAAGTGTRCTGLLAGPYSGINDGVWIRLDPRHEGATVATDISESDLQGNGLDSDCYFLDHMLNVVGNGNNGGGPCAGNVPAGAYWMYLYPYGHGAVFPGFQVDFTLDPAISSAAEEQGRPVGETLMEDYEDKGSYWMNTETNVCYVKESAYTAAARGVHYVAFGTWFFQETNGIPGLQANAGDAAGNPGVDDACTGGDLTAL